jgi:hypothetical protein
MDLRITVMPMLWYRMRENGMRCKRWDGRFLHFGEDKYCEILAAARNKYGSAIVGDHQKEGRRGRLPILRDPDRMTATS